MADPIRKDFTRWNRAGLKKIRYIDGTAISYLDLLQKELARVFPDWEGPAGIETDTLSDSERMIRQYEAVSDDMTFAFLKTIARSCHLLTEHVDAIANEAYMGTATLWESLRKLAGMVNYRPKPHGSAVTHLGFLAKEKIENTRVAKGFQVKYTPKDGGHPIVFESLEDMDLSFSRNRIHVSEYQRNPASLGGHSLTLDGGYDINNGDPIVLEDETSTTLSAHQVRSVRVSEQATRLEVSPSIPRRFICGYTLVHILPKDILKVKGPVSKGSFFLNTFCQLTGPAHDLSPGETIIVGTGKGKPVYRRIRHVNETSLVFDREVGPVTPGKTGIFRPVVLAVTAQGQRKTKARVVNTTVYVAGDYSRLIQHWAAHKVKISGKTQVVMVLIFHAKYVPADIEKDLIEPDDKPGFTALNLRWHPDEDDLPGTGDYSLKNPQYLLVPPVGKALWHLDTFLTRQEKNLPDQILASIPKKSGPGDCAVLAMDHQYAWTRLSSVSVDIRKEKSSLSGKWQDRGGGPFFISRTTLYSAFSKTVRPLHHDINKTPVTGYQFPVEKMPATLKKGDTLICENGHTAIQTTIKDMFQSGKLSWLVLNDPVPFGSTCQSLVLCGNVILAGHGEKKPETVLGSGDATLSHQRFLVSADAVSFIADPQFPSGVRADILVHVTGRTWTQVAALVHSGAADTHYRVEMTAQKQCAITFGDGIHGRRLPTGVNNVTVSCRSGAGARGNLAAGFLTTPVKPHSAVAGVVQPLPAAGGADMEAVESIRENAPLGVLTLGRAVSLDDFSSLCTAHTSVSQARALAKPTPLQRRESIEVVVVPAGRAAFTPALKHQVEQYLLSHTLPGVSCRVCSYDAVLFGIRVAIQVDTTAFSRDKTAGAVKDALGLMFSQENRQLGQSLYLSELYRVVEGIKGVENAVCKIHYTPDSGDNRPVSSGSDGLIRILPARANELIHLKPETPDIIIETSEYQL